MKTTITSPTDIVQLFDGIQAQHQELTYQHRVHLSGIARGYRLMCRYSELTDEWLAGNHLYVTSANVIQAVVGKAEKAITERIRDAIDAGA